MMKGQLIILSGPSGVGKDTILNEWIDANDRIRRVVTYTTRNKRPGEKEGIDYCFVSVEEFHELIRQDAFIEYKEVYGNFYGSPKTSTDEMLKKGLVPVLKIDVEGALDAMQLRPDATTIFLLPPSKEELINRITKRATEDALALKKRIDKSEWELSQANEYQYKIVNDTIPEVIEKLNSVIKEKSPA